MNPANLDPFEMSGNIIGQPVQTFFCAPVKIHFEVLSVGLPEHMERQCGTVDPVFQTSVKKAVQCPADRLSVGNDHIDAPDLLSYLL